MSPSEMAWQASLFDSEEVGFDAAFSEVKRIKLDDSAWVDYAPGWVTGSDRLFGEVLESRDWAQGVRRMYDKKVREPRLTAPWGTQSGEPLEPPVLENMRRVLSGRYGV